VRCAKISRANQEFSVLFCANRKGFAPIELITDFKRLIELLIGKFCQCAEHNAFCAIARLNLKGRASDAFQVIAKLGCDSLRAYRGFWCNDNRQQRLPISGKREPATLND
jgi:hypothetical protein